MGKDVMQQSKIEEMEKLETSNKELAIKNEELIIENEKVSEENSQLTESMKGLDTKLKMQDEKLSKFEENVVSMSNEIECLKSDKANIEMKIKEESESRERAEAKSKKLQDELKSTNASRETLASSVSQLITDTNELKDKIEFMGMEHEKEKKVYEREKQELKAAIEEKELTLFELE